MEDEHTVMIDKELAERGRLIRSVLALREMLPGSFVEARRQCGNPTCRCADGTHLHPRFQLSVLVDGKPRAFHIPAVWAEEVRARVAMHKRAQEALARICQINLQGFLRRKAAKGPPP